MTNYFQPVAKRFGTWLALILAAAALFNLIWLTGRFGDGLDGYFWTSLMLIGAGAIEIWAGLVLRIRRSGYQAAILLAITWALNLTGLITVLTRLGYPEHLVHFFNHPNLNSPVWYDAVFFSFNLGLTFSLTFHLASLSPARLKGRSADYWAWLLIMVGAGLSLYVVTFARGWLAPARPSYGPNMAFAANLLVFSLMMAILFLKAVRPRRSDGFR